VLCNKAVCIVSDIPLDCASPIRPRQIISTVPTGYNRFNRPCRFGSQPMCRTGKRRALTRKFVAGTWYPDRLSGNPQIMLGYQKEGMTMLLFPLSCFTLYGFCT